MNPQEFKRKPATMRFDSDSSPDRMEDARAAGSEVLKPSPNFSVEHFTKAMPYKDEEPRKPVSDALRKAGLQ